MSSLGRLVATLGIDSADWITRTDEGRVPDAAVREVGVQGIEHVGAGDRAKLALAALSIEKAFEWGKNVVDVGG